MAIIRAQSFTAIHPILYLTCDLGFSSIIFYGYYMQNTSFIVRGTFTLQILRFQTNPFVKARRKKYCTQHTSEAARCGSIRVLSVACTGKACASSKSLLVLPNNLLVQCWCDGRCGLSPNERIGNA